MYYTLILLNFKKIKEVFDFNKFILTILKKDKTYKNKKIIIL